MLPASSMSLHGMITPLSAISLGVMPSGWAVNRSGISLPEAISRASCLPSSAIGTTRQSNSTFNACSTRSMIGCSPVSG